MAINPGGGHCCEINSPNALGYLSRYPLARVFKTYTAVPNVDFCRSAPIFFIAAPSFERAVLLAWASGEVATLSGHCTCLLGFLSVLGAADGALCVPYSAAQV